MSWKDKLRKKAYEASLAASGMTPAEIKEMLKSRSKEKMSTFSVNFFPFLTKLFIILLVVFQAFYPLVVSGILLYLILIIVVLIVTSILLGGFSAVILGKTIPALVVVFIIVFFIWFIPSPNYSKWLAVRFGTLNTSIIFLLVTGISLVFLAAGTKGFVVGTIIWYLLLFWGGPFILNTTAPGSGFCIPESAFEKVGQLPYVTQFLQQYKCEHRLTKQTLVYQGRMVKIPVSGGIYVEFGFNGRPRPLAAGQTYQEVFTLRNYYDGNINIISFKPWIHSNYKSGIDFISSYQLKKNKLAPKELYQDLITFDPKTMEVNASIKCPWTEQEIQANKGYTGIKKVECAENKACSKGACVAVANYVCTCVDWTNATCSGDSLYIAANVTHTGFFRGNASLYYSENPTSETINFPQLTQGPISITLNFIPNPYIRKYYEKFINTTQLFADFDSHGYKIKIINISVRPVLTTITTRDYQNMIEYNETIGIQKQKNDCSGLKQLKDAVNNKGRTRWSGVICNFTKPEVNLTVTNMRNYETVTENDIDLDQLAEYCSGKLKSTKDVFKQLEGYGLCSLLNNTAIQHALEFTQVVLEMNYTITQTFYSSSISPYWTSACR